MEKQGFWDKKWVKNTTWWTLQVERSASGMGIFLGLCQLLMIARPGQPLEQINKITDQAAIFLVPSLLSFAIVEIGTRLWHLPRTDDEFKQKKD